MGKYKTKAIQASLGIFMHIWAYSGNIQPYSEPCVTLAYSEYWYNQNSEIFKIRYIFRTLVHPKLWYIQNQRHIQNPGLFRTRDIFRTRGILRTLSNIYHGMLWETANDYNHFCKLYNYFCNTIFSIPLVHQIWFLQYRSIFHSRNLYSM